LLTLGYEVVSRTSPLISAVWPEAARIHKSARAMMNILEVFFFIKTFNFYLRFRPAKVTATGKQFIK
jgi:hypothetical protein